MTKRHLTREAADAAFGPPRLLTRQQAAATLSVGITTVDALVATGELASLKIGKARRVLAVSVDEYIERKIAEGVA